MCSFFFTNKKISNIDEVNYFLQRRGPDKTNIFTNEKFTYLHNLLSITGKFSPQPLENNDVILMYNGEIYNYLEFGNYPSDGDSIIDLYLNLGVKSFELLDGEFAICIHDLKRQEIILVTDTFSTKPLFFSVNDGYIGVSSYVSTLEKSNFVNIQKVESNTIIVFDDTTFEIKERKKLYLFDITQNVTSFDSWIENFKNAISKRVNTELDVLVPMSSGHDSGAICSFLNEMNRDYISYTILGNEDRKIISDRLTLNTNKRKEIIESLNQKKLEEISSQFISYVEKFDYGPNPYKKTHNGFDDFGAIGLFHILNEMKSKFGIKIVISGQGSDEIMSNNPNYGFETSNPSIFPEDLKTIFPWGNFFLGSQWSYLMKEECIAGSLGIETRYPFLDRKVVQSYLNLNHNLKNLYYKSPITHYFKSIEYPYHSRKIGFQIF